MIFALPQSNPSCTSFDSPRQRLPSKRPADPPPCTVSPLPSVLASVGLYEDAQRPPPDSVASCRCLLPLPLSPRERRIKGLRRHSRLAERGWSFRRKFYLQAGPCPACTAHVEFPQGCAASPNSMGCGASPKLAPGRLAPNDTHPIRDLAATPATPSASLLPEPSRPSIARTR